MRAPIDFFPIRHHSPACAAHLSAALRALRPAAILLEAPEDFGPLLANLVAPDVKPPIAVVSLPEREAIDEEDEGRASYYPLCDHAPELVALRIAQELAIPVEAIDLPSRSKAMLRAQKSADRPHLLTNDERLTVSDYIDALCERTGARDGVELWDRLFESRLGERDWDAFFRALDAYCGHLRELARPEDIEADGTLARERHMAAKIAEAAERHAGARIAVVTGGFHTPVLREAGGARPSGAREDAPRRARIYLIRYGFPQLDLANGYGAGLPSPGYYDLLWKAKDAGDALWRETTHRCLEGFARRLAETDSGLSFPVAARLAAAECAFHLADLRNLPGPGRSELIDAVLSTGVKDAAELGAPLTSAFSDWLTGDALGELPLGAHAPPLVAAVRAAAVALGFSLERVAPATKELDIYRKPRHAAASRFLHALELIGAGFAQRLAGPDFAIRQRSGFLHEQWSYMWGPAVEAALVDRSLDGDRLLAVCAAEIRRRLAALETAGEGRDAARAARLFLAAAMAGLQGELDCVADAMLPMLAECPDIGRLAEAFRLLLVVMRLPNSRAGEQPAALRRLIDIAYRGMTRHLASLTRLDREAALAVARDLGELAGFVVGPEAAALGLDPAILSKAVSEALDSGDDPFFIGSIGAVALTLGALDEEGFERRIASVLAGAYERPSRGAEALTGLLATEPRIFVGSRPLIAAVHRYLAGFTEEDFLAVLPELRSAFSELDPSEIDRLAELIPGVSESDAVDEEAISEAERAENEKLMEEVAAQWRADGLAEWLGLSP
ncbi:DUF5682 family protein [Methylosinus sp. LW4]|uniref:DUF5682 family protein n=1 Tax=Methylosinus sp. LW4 TaxID=136993 RepID=UPI00036244C5|nr:DUF5682 family protein [Methylosinus sp. LW4]